ncbi:MAG: hypothetical protein A3G88_05930 [Omnitrophica WOR_2 bacterium RIFCSPLOWO2_12_FULL_63_16]|nr:MAG: hypothetical protein A3G88_05930 [Omnitrophica WOR_2 bacterium RIFCSPLOWO2_12_FULL_63_16]
MRKTQRILVGAALGGGVGLIFCGIAVLGSNVTAWALMPVSIPVVLATQFTVNVWVIAAGVIGYFAGVGGILAWIGQSRPRSMWTLNLAVLAVLLIAHTGVYHFSSLSHINEIAAKALVDALIQGLGRTPP